MTRQRIELDVIIWWSARHALRVARDKAAPEWRLYDAVKEAARAWELGPVDAEGRPRCAVSTSAEGA